MLALVLMVGFYALALGIVGGLLYAAAFGLTYGSLNGIKLAIGCSVSAFIVAKAVVPQRETFEAPGPRLSREDCPALFDAIEDLARKTGQEVPHDVYLVNDVNAFVTRRGGFMGFGSTPVMGIGLPLLHALNTEEARGVIKLASTKSPGLRNCARRVPPIAGRRSTPRRKVQPQAASIPQATLSAVHARPAQLFRAISSTPARRTSRARSIVDSHRVASSDSLGGGVPPAAPQGPKLGNPSP